MPTGDVAPSSAAGNISDGVNTVNVYSNMAYDNGDSEQMFGDREIGSKYQNDSSYPYHDYQQHYMGTFDVDVNGLKTEPVMTPAAYQNEPPQPNPMLVGLGEFPVQPAPESEAVPTGEDTLMVGNVPEHVAYANFKQEMCLKLKEIIFQGRASAEDTERGKNLFWNVSYCRSTHVGPIQSKFSFRRSWT